MTQPDVVPPVGDGGSNTGTSEHPSHVVEPSCGSPTPHLVEDGACDCDCTRCTLFPGDVCICADCVSPHCDHKVRDSAPAVSASTGDDVHQRDLVTQRDTALAEARLARGELAEARATITAQATELATALHPTEKPVGILDPLIRYVCPEGGTVLDPFAGSGSTEIADAAMAKIGKLTDAIIDLKKLLGIPVEASE